jgi:type 1 fimbriae regulatory protein FimB
MRIGARLQLPVEDPEFQECPRCQRSHKACRCGSSPCIGGYAKYFIMRRTQASDGCRAQVARLKNSLSVEQPIAGDELRAIKRFLVTRDDRLPWLFLSERQAASSLARRSTTSCARPARRRIWAAFGRSCSGTVAATILPTRARISARCRITLGHSDPKHTADYTRVAGHLFEGLWK